MYISLKDFIKKIVGFRIKAQKVLKFFPDITLDEYSAQARDIRNIDENMIGRYCGSFEDKIMQTMCCGDAAKRFPSDRQYAHVEIGVLFGGSILAKLSVLRRNNIDQSIIAIDPFEGYYEEEKDPITNMKVTEQNVIDNIQKFGFDSEVVRIIKKYSTDKEVRDILSKYKIISLMIDGDHTHEGIRHDWETYSGQVEAGGAVIFDDYKDPSWPDVTRFVDELIASQPPGWKVLGELDTTLVIKRVEQ